MPGDRFDEIKAAAGGMLAPEAYAEISRCAARARGDVVEVGTAHGASAIAAALGLDPSRRVHTIDRIAGGSRDAFGGIEDNRRIIEQNFTRFGVADRVTLHVGLSDEVAPRLDRGRPLGMLILDADGAVDRDLALFYDRLAPGSPIVIDDVGDDFVAATRINRNWLKIDQKFRLTASLVRLFEEQGLLARDRMIGWTWFGRKPEDARPFRPDPDAVLGVYRRLTFATTRHEDSLVAAALAPARLARRGLQVLRLRLLSKPSAGT